MFQNRNGYADNWLPSGSVVKKKKKTTLPLQEVQVNRFIPWAEKIPWRRKWQPTPCLENPTDRKAWRATVLGVANSWTFAQLDTTGQACTTHIIAELKMEVSV